jgi:membrane-bound inhibitor of C-type lysozyme
MTEIPQLGAAALAVMLAQDLPPVTYHCNDAGKSTIIAQFRQTDPPTVKLKRGKDKITATEGPTGSGARYVTADGILFWEKGGQAQVEWPKGKRFTCSAKKTG